MFKVSTAYFLLTSVRWEQDVMAAGQSPVSEGTVMDPRCQGHFVGSQLQAVDSDGSWSVDIGQGHGGVDGVSGCSGGGGSSLVTHSDEADGDLKTW